MSDLAGRASTGLLRVIREWYKPLLLLTPALAYLGLFIAYPIVDSFATAFFYKGYFSLESVEYLLYSPLSKFWEALKYTLVLAALVVPIETTLALIATLVLLQPFKGRDTAVYILTIPIAISDVAAGLIWYSMLTSKGFINKVLLGLGLIDSPIVFFGYEYRDRALLAIVMAEVWRSMALVFIIIFAGAQLIHKELFEAAEVFGASFWVKLRHVLFPLIKPSIQAALIIRTLFAFQVFAVVWVLAGRDVPVLAGEAYYTLVELYRFDVAALYALVIAALSMSTGILYLRFLRARHLEVGRS